MNHNTKVINLFGGPGTGKSTLAAEIYLALKKSGESVELVREYVKDWAWQNRKIEQYDQLYITSKQARAEYTKYGKVRYIITDSPVLLGPFFCEYYAGVQLTMGAVQSFMELAQQNGVTYHNFLLPRNKPYETAGRYETEEEAKKIDKALLDFLTSNHIHFTKLKAGHDPILDIFKKVGVLDVDAA